MSLSSGTVARAAVYIILSEFCFASMGAAVKTLSASLPQETIIFFRNLFALLMIIPLLARNMGEQPLFSTRLIHWHLLRTAAGLSAMYCFFFSIESLPLAQAALLKMTAPLFIPMIVLLLFREHSSTAVMLALPVGFAGVAVLLNPESTLSGPVLLGLLGGALAALAQVCVGRLSKQEPILRIVFYFTLLSTLVSAIPLMWGWQLPTGRDTVILLIMGGMGALGQLLMSRGFAQGATGSVACFTYFSVLFSSFYGFVLWDELLDWHFYLGTLLIVTAGFMIIGEKALRRAN